MLVFGREVLDDGDDELTHPEAEFAHFGVVDDDAVLLQVQPVLDVDIEGSAFIGNPHGVVDHHGVAIYHHRRFANDIASSSHVAVPASRREGPDARLGVAIGIDEFLVQRADPVRVPTADEFALEAADDPAAAVFYDAVSGHGAIKVGFRHKGGSRSREVFNTHGCASRARDCQYHGKNTAFHVAPLGYSRIYIHIIPDILGRMSALVAWFQDDARKREMHPLLLIAVFIVHFLAIHPFQDGNGRLSRVLTTLLLLQAGYHCVTSSRITC